MNRGRPKGTEKYGIKFLTDSQCDAFMRAAKKHKRDSFLFSLMLFVGARVSEITNLKFSDINDQSYQIFIQGKKNGASRHYTMRCFVSTKFGPLMIFLKRWFAYNKITQGEMHEYQEKAIA
jgi:integrase